MKYSVEWLKSKLEEGDFAEYLFFWGHRPKQPGTIDKSCFSQWYPLPFVVDNTLYHTAEHWMMAQKAVLFDNQDIFDKILRVKSPAEAKDLGRQVRNFNEELWLEKRSEIVLQGSVAKFSQHKELQTFLLNTKDRILVEASPVDVIWGIGLAANDEKVKNPNLWNGLNLLGFTLMEVRDILNEKN